MKTQLPPKYGSTHEWMRRYYGKANHCEKCGNTSVRMYHWSNISRTYKRERSDWQQLCVPCHKMFDFTEKARKNLSIAHTKAKSILQLTPDANLVSKHELLFEAAKTTGISKTAINNCLMGRSKSSGGYIWRYA